MFGYHSDKLTKKTIRNEKTRLNQYRVFEYGQYKFAKPLWGLVKSPSLDMDMVWVNSYDIMGHEAIQDVLMGNGIGDMLAAIAEHEQNHVDHLSILNYSFLVTRKNARLNFHLVRESEPELLAKSFATAYAFQYAT